MPRGWFVVSILLALNLRTLVVADTLVIDTPMSPPTWALLQREVLRASAQACREFFQRYFDERGYLLCVERWGGDDGPDDAIENCNDWPLLHALGAEDDVLRMFQKAWEGHLRQYTLAKTSEVPMARDGMYYKEFPVMFDWVHLGEGLSAFSQLGLSDPTSDRFAKRMRRFAGFYLNEDPGAPNYDPEHKIIRSLFNGSRGPLLRKATALDWTGDPIEVEGRFVLGHGERSYAEMLAHFEDYNDIVGDHPQNLCATSLALHAYALSHEPKFKRWLLEYVDAWRHRMAENGRIIPTNVGLDGKIGSAADGKWYGGVYGWAFSVTVPQTGQLAHRNTHQLGLVGFGNAYLLTGDDRYLEPWRKMTDTINNQRKRIHDQWMYPTMYGDEGWYAFRPTKYSSGALEMYYWSMKRADRDRLSPHAWVSFLEGEAPDYPEQALRQDLETVRERLEAMRRDTTTPDTRLADDPLKYNPATVTSLVNLTLGGIHPGRSGGPLHCRLRYFDPLRRRAGLPPDVAALVTELTADATEVVLVNVHQTQSRELIAQMGGYGEHRCDEIELADRRVPMRDSRFRVRLAPGCGATLRIKNSRYVNPPTLAHPW